MRSCISYKTRKILDAIANNVNLLLANYAHTVIILRKCFGSRDCLGGRGICTRGACWGGHFYALAEANKDPEEAPTLVVVMSEAHVIRGGTISIAILCGHGLKPSSAPPSSEPRR
jgi:hypothetical protein